MILKPSSVKRKKQNALFQFLLFRILPFLLVEMRLHSWFWFSLFFSFLTILFFLFLVSWCWKDYILGEKPNQQNQINPQKAIKKNGDNFPQKPYTLRLVCSIA